MLIIGAGNSGCDIAVDAVHHAASVDISVRRGYYFVPKYLFGKPADTLNQGKPLPPRIKQAIDSRVLRMFTGDPVRFGFPKPDYKIYESHPIVNSLVLHHLGHGDLRAAGRRRFDGGGVGSSTERAPYDVIVLATGYHLHYPFLDRALLGWAAGARRTSTSTCSPEDPNLFVLGMIEASGIGWQGRYEQAELVASYLRARTTAPAAAAALEQRVAGPRPDLSGGYHYLGLERMSYYVNKDAYRRAVRSEIERLGQDRGAAVLHAGRPTSTTSRSTSTRRRSTMLKIVIATILFGIALDIKIDDFTAAVRRPFPILIGIVAQFLLLPALTLAADDRARRPRLDRARHDPGRLLPARERLQHPHPPRRRRRGAVGLDDRDQQPAGDLHAADQLGLLGRAPPPARSCSRTSTWTRSRCSSRSRW